MLLRNASSNFNIFWYLLLTTAQNAGLGSLSFFNPVCYQLNFPGVQHSLCVHNILFTFKALLMKNLNFLYLISTHTLIKHILVLLLLPINHL